MNSWYPSSSRKGRLMVQDGQHHWAWEVRIPSSPQFPDLSKVTKSLRFLVHPLYGTGKAVPFITELMWRNALEFARVCFNFFS